jgi:hypothetical protein
MSEKCQVLFEWPLTPFNWYFWKLDEVKQLERINISVTDTSLTASAASS